MRDSKRNAKFLNRAILLPVLGISPHLIATTADDLDRLNILWLAAEDLIPCIALYGDESVAHSDH